MLLKFICTAFLLYICVQINVGECESDEKVPVHKCNKNTKIRLQINDLSSIVEQLQIGQIRLELNRQSELLNETITEQNRQSKVQNDVLSQLSQLNERLNKLTSLMPIQYPSSCENVPAVNRRTGIHQIVVPSYSRDPFNVSCDEKTQGGGWTTVLRREDGSVNFFLLWDDYQKGFGNLAGEFFIGLDKLHFMTKGVNQELLITMEHPNGTHAFAKYDRFVIEGEYEAYELSSLGKYSGNAGDSLKRQLGNKFTSRDNDNDVKYGGNCAERYKGGWWYGNCHDSNLMGRYNETRNGEGINWRHFNGHDSSLKRVEMMIRPRRD